MDKRPYVLVEADSSHSLVTECEKLCDEGYELHTSGLTLGKDVNGHPKYFQWMVLSRVTLNQWLAWRFEHGRALD